MLLCKICNNNNNNVSLIMSLCSQCVILSIIIFNGNQSKKLPLVLLARLWWHHDVVSTNKAYIVFCILSNLHYKICHLNENTYIIEYIEWAQNYQCRQVNWHYLRLSFAALMSLWTICDTNNYVDRTAWTICRWHCCPGTKKSNRVLGIGNFFENFFGQNRLLISQKLEFFFRNALFCQNDNFLGICDVLYFVLTYTQYAIPDSGAKRPK